MFIQPRDVQALFEIGDHLGAMASEMRTLEFIEEFVRRGPKYYSYEIVHTATGERKTVCEFRGIALNYNASQLVNLRLLKT